MQNSDSPLTRQENPPTAKGPATGHDNNIGKYGARLKYKLLMVMVVSTLIVVITSMTLLAWSDYKMVKRITLDSGLSISRSLSRSFVGILAFSDSELAHQTSRSLIAFSDVLHIYLFNLDGDIVYHYARDDQPAQEPPEYLNHSTPTLENDTLSFYMPVYYQSEEYGTAYFKLAMRQLSDWKEAYLTAIYLIVPLILLITVILSYRLQRIFTDPIQSLSTSLQETAASGDFSVRLTSSENNEIGTLYDNVNFLYDTIEASSYALLQHKEAIDSAAIVSMTDADGLITYVNERFLEISKYNREELIGKNHRILSSGYHTRDFFKQLWTTISSGRVWHGEVCNMDKDGEFYWVDSTIIPFLDNQGKPKEYISIRFPITERKNFELELRSQKETLEYRVKERTRELEDSREKLVESEKMAALGGLVAGIAHEINTPVGVGITAITHLEDETGQISSRVDNNQVTKTELQDYLSTSKESSHIIHSNLEKAAQLVRSFKQVSSDQSNHEKRAFDLCEYLQEIILSLRPKLKHSQHAVTIDCKQEYRMHSYPGALSQVITNLITNSLRYAFDEGVNGRLQISVREVDDTRIELIYRDDGKGMSTDNIKQAFDPFFTTGRNKGGTGLGLHIVYNLVTQTLKGEIRIDSKYRKGLKYVIVMPRQIEDDEIPS